MTHWQILAKDPDRLAAFYGKLFGWKVEAGNAMGYRTVDPGSRRGIPGGFWPAGPEGHALVQLFIDVEDVGQSVARVKELGGRVLVPPQVLPGGDELAIVLDPEGLSLGLTKPGKGTPGLAPGVRRKRR